MYFFTLMWAQSHSVSSLLCGDIQNLRPIQCPRGEIFDKEDRKPGFDV